MSFPRVVLAVTGVVACAACQERIILRPTPPTRIAILLRTDPFLGKCVSTTIPQVAPVFRGDKIQWEVVNVDCKDVPTVELRFRETVVRFAQFDQDCEGTPRGTTGRPRAKADDKRRPADACPVEAGKPTVPFRFRAIGNAAFDVGRHKYDVLVNGEAIDTTGEDPELCGRKHCY
jgi:hypothetical protein